MKIYSKSGVELHDALVTKTSEHEQELMKSDFVKLQWNDNEKYIIPVDAYIQPFAESGDLTKYSLLEPYEPTQKSEAEWQYEPQFQHPKMYLSKVTFENHSNDSEGNPADFMEWKFTGFINDLLLKFCKAIDDVFGWTNAMSYSILQPQRGVDSDGNAIYATIENIVTVTFSSQDILSALTNTANVEGCEWHLDYDNRKLYFGFITLNPSQLAPYELVVGENVQVPSMVKDSKDGYWNAFKAQGSSRNMSRRAASGENVQATIRLGLDEEKYPDGIVYTDGDGGVITKSEFISRGLTPYVKPLIFDSVYPKLNLYAYNVRCREYYQVDNDTKEKVIGGYDAEGKPIYKRAAIWYMRLAYPLRNSRGDVVQWYDYSLQNEVFAYVTKKTKEADHYYTLNLDMKYEVLMYEDIYSYGNTGKYEHRVNLKCGDVTVKAAAREYKDGKVIITLHTSRERIDLIEAFAAAVDEGSLITFIDGDFDVYPDKAPSANVASQVIDGKELYGAFQPNTYTGAESCPLAGRGDGDEGYYGFKMKFISNEKEAEDRTAAANPDEGDTGVTVHVGDYEIFYQENDNYILPTIASQGIIPKGVKVSGQEVSDLNALANKNDGQKGNIVNLYNIVMDSTAEIIAQNDLENEVKKYIFTQNEDNDSYTLKSNPIAFESSNPNLYIGQEVKLVNGDYEQVTRVMKIITKLDYDFEQEIVVGNKVIKSSQATMKEKVESIISGGASGAGSGISESTVYSILNAWAIPRFLSKLEDDIAQGVITFVKGIVASAKSFFNGIENEGELINSGDVTIGGSLEVNGAGNRMNDIQSHDYTGDGIADSGWRITNSYNGHSKLTIDELYVRMKAVFESLEVKRELVTGGNHIQSCAASVISKVDYLDINKHPLGYSEVKVPFTFKGFLLTLRKLQNPIGIFSKKETVRLQLSATDRQNICYVRCYFLAEEGGRKIQNWWQGGTGFSGNDLARCQTFNLTSDSYSERGEYYDSGNTKQGNIFWWRKVAGVSSLPVTINGKQYHYFDVYCNPTAEAATHYNYPGAMQGSDIPAVGDEVSQWGNDTNVDRMNLIAFEVNGQDAAIKMYEGINQFSMTDGFYGNPLKIRFAPKTGCKVATTKWEVVTESFVAPVPVECGNWLDITPVQGQRTARYYEIYQHNGSSWLCVASNGGSFKVIEAFTYNGQTYEVGDTVSQETYDCQDPLFGVNRQMCCARETFGTTTDEPSTSSAAWRQYAAKGIDGTSAWIGTIDRNTYSIQCDASGTITSQQAVTVNLSLLHGSEAQSFKISGIKRNSTTVGNSRALISSGIMFVIDNDTFSSLPSAAATAHSLGVIYFPTSTINGSDDIEITLTDANGGNQKVLHLIVNGIRPGANGTNGKDGWMITADPANVIITQALGNDTTQFSTVKVGFTAKKGNVAATISSLAIPTGQQALSAEFNAAIGTGDDAKKVIVSSPKTYTPQGGTAQYYTEGTFEVVVNVTDPDTNTNVAFNITVPCYANLLGTWKRSVEAGEETIAANKIIYTLSASGNNIETIKADYTSKRSAVGQFETFKSNYESDGASINNINSRISTAEGNISTVRRSVSSFNILTGLSDGSGWTKDSFTTTTCMFYASEKIVSPLTRELPAGDYVISCYPSSDTIIEVKNAVGTVLASGFGTNISDDVFNDVTRYYLAFTLNSATAIKIEFSYLDEGQYYSQTVYRPQLEEGSFPSAFDGASAVTESQIKQAADEIDASITTKLGQTGINIDGNTREINLIADRVKFKNSAGTVDNKIWIDGTTGALHCQDAILSGSLYLPFTIITRDNYEQYANWWNPDDHNDPFDIDFSKSGLNAQVNYAWLDDHSGHSLTYEMKLPFPFLTDFYGAELKIFNARTSRLIVLRQLSAGGGLMTTEIAAKTICTFKLVDISHLLPSEQQYYVSHVTNAFDYKGVHYEAGYYNSSLCWVVINTVTIQ